MFTGLLLRWGLGAIAPFVLPVLLGLLIGGTGFTAWWNEWFDLPSTAILVAGAALVYLYAATNSQIGRLLIVAVLVGLGWLKGTLDETRKSDDKVAAAEAALHATYKEATTKETARQEAVNKEAAHKAELEKQSILRQLLESRGELQKVREEADRDKNAQRPALGVDSIDRINRLRGKQPRRVRPSRPKA